MTNNIESTTDCKPQQPLFAIPVVGSSTVFNAHYSTVIGLFPDKYFDWAVCDIPYGIGVAKMAYLKETKTTVKQKNGTRINPNRNKHKHTFKDWDNLIVNLSDLKLIRNIFRTKKKDGSIINET